MPRVYGYSPGEVAREVEAGDVGRAVERLEWDVRDRPVVRPGAGLAAPLPARVGRLVAALLFAIFGRRFGRVLREQAHAVANAGAAHLLHPQTRVDFLRKSK